MHFGAHFSLHILLPKFNGISILISTVPNMIFIALDSIFKRILYA